LFPSVTLLIAPTSCFSSCPSQSIDPSILLIEARREITGRIDDVTGEILFGDLSHPEIDDILDDLGEMVMKRGGKVVITPADKMPSQTGAAAIYRY